MTSRRCQKPLDYVALNRRKRAAEWSVGRSRASQEVTDALVKNVRFTSPSSRSGGCTFNCLCLDQHEQHQGLVPVPKPCLRCTRQPYLCPQISFVP